MCRQKKIRRWRRRACDDSRHCPPRWFSTEHTRIDASTKSTISFKNLKFDSASPSLFRACGFRATSAHPRDSEGDSVLVCATATNQAPTTTHAIAREGCCQPGVCRPSAFFTFLKQFNDDTQIPDRTQSRLIFTYITTEHTLGVWKIGTDRNGTRGEKAPKFSAGFLRVDPPVDNG